MECKIIYVEELETEYNLYNLKIYRLESGTNDRERNLERH